jgi:L-seryl-tRNA(Ser) seleniumtransferase
MISKPLTEIQRMAEKWRNTLNCGELVAGQSTVGGGSLPGETLPTILFAFSVRSPQAILTKLRNLDTPIIARIEADKVVFDPRTVLADQEDTFLLSLKQIITTGALS